MPEIHVTATYLPNPLDNPSVRLGPTGDPGGGDPIGFAGDPANLYRYGANNPVNWSDPF